MAMVAASYRRFGHPPAWAAAGHRVHASDRPRDHALNVGTPPPQGARRAWTAARVLTRHDALTRHGAEPPAPAGGGARASARRRPRAARRGGATRTPAGLRERCRALGRVQLCPGSRRPRGVRDITGGSRGVGPRTPGRDGGLQAASAAVRAGGGAAGRGARGRASRAARKDGRGGAPGRSACWWVRAGGLTDSRALHRNFSANFLWPCIPWPKGYSTPVPPGPKGMRKAPEPYGDRPRSRGALPSNARECNAS